MDGKKLPPVAIVCRNNIPISSGFGSSVSTSFTIIIEIFADSLPQIISLCEHGCLKSATIIGGLIAGLVLSGTELTVGQTWDGKEVNEELLQLANEIEGHPDNVAPV